MSDDESLEAAPPTANRNDTRRAALITVVGLVAVLIAGTLVVVGGIAP